jgi:hypothetical protein
MEPWSESELAAAARGVTTFRFMTIALLAGCGIFATIVLVMPHEAPADEPIGSYVMLGLAVACLAALTVTTGPLAAAAGRKRLAGVKPSGEADSLRQRLFGQYTIMFTRRVALLEGPSFALLVAYMLERQVWVLAVVGALMLGLAAQFPTESRLSGWVDGQIERIRDESRQV